MECCTYYWLLLVALVGLGTAVNGVFFDSWTTTWVALVSSGLGMVVFYLVTEFVIRIIRYVIKGVKIQKGRTSKLQAILFVVSLSVLAIGLVLIPIDRAKKIRADEQAKVEAKKEYAEAKEHYDELTPKVAECYKPIIENSVQDAVYECNKRKNKVRADYNFCTSLTYINTHASCIYENDYTVINCSEDYLRKTTPISPTNLDAECQSTYFDWSQAGKIIKDYESSEFLIEK
ncbi:MAG: hypothetical protein AAB590_01095 [Patescibacteria group bacterium]